ncbi:gamma-glutamyltranspeptidase 1-like protein [Tanacetum coccineum]
MRSSRLLTWTFITYTTIFLLLRVATARREMITKQNGVVATDELMCSRMGRDVLREGGNAVDASIAVGI